VVVPCALSGGAGLPNLFFSGAVALLPVVPYTGIRLHAAPYALLYAGLLYPARPVRVACIVLVLMLVYPIYLVLSMIFSIFIVLYFLYIGCKIATNIIFVQFYFAVSLNIIYKGHRQPDTPGG
jgi:hypothetical protein